MHHLTVANLTAITNIIRDLLNGLADFFSTFILENGTLGDLINAFLPEDLTWIGNIISVFFLYLLFTLLLLARYYGLLWLLQSGLLAFSPNVC